MHSRWRSSCGSARSRPGVYKGRGKFGLGAQPIGDQAEHRLELDGLGAGQDVDLARVVFLFGREPEPARQVAHVHPVQERAAGADDGQATPLDATEQLPRAGVAGSPDHGRADDASFDPGDAKVLERQLLALALGCLVDVARPVLLALVGGRVRNVAVNAGRATVNDLSDPRGDRRVQHVSRSIDVDGPVRTVSVLGLAEQRGDVEYDVAALEGGSQGLRVRHVTYLRVYTEAFEHSHVARRSVQGRDVIAARPPQLTAELATDEARRAGDRAPHGIATGHISVLPPERGKPQA
jgi:hypothetical protein